MSVWWVEVVCKCISAQVCRYYGRYLGTLDTEKARVPRRLGGCIGGCIGKCIGRCIGRCIGGVIDGGRFQGEGREMVKPQQNPAHG